ncbi:MAG: mevalonate kinase, partial [Methanothrix sp.]|nr:mevalonate kinase [Methanothrix sp.]
MTTASAPGKIILFGEHAVVSGVTALGGAIDLRAKVTIQDLAGKVLIETEDLALRGFSMDLITGQLVSANALHATRYVSAALREFEARDLSVKIKSKIPLAAGLGSSAAIVVATVAALNGHLGLGLSRTEIASTAYRIEKKVQNNLGSPMDTALATYGGYCRVTKEVQPLDLPQLEMVVGCTKLPHNTSSEVKKVQRLKECYPDVVEPIFQAIGAISMRAVPLIKEQDMSGLGELMNINHGLLEALGVGTRELSELVYAARNAGGAYGAKLTGAGGGGCMIALPKPGSRDALMAALRQARGSAF